jgi:hypothetical protein
MVHAHSGEVKKHSGLPSAINFNLENPGNSMSSSIRRVVPRAERFICCTFCMTNGLFLSHIPFIRKLIEASNDCMQSAHGPCLSDKDETMNMTVCFHLQTWPRQAEQWIYRHRPGQWPTDILINDIVNYCCILVPIGPKEIDNNELLWRMSFSMADKQLSHSMNYTQILCYALLKLSLKNIINRNDKVKDLLCSYFMMFRNKIVGTITALHPCYYLIKTKEITVE